MELKTYLKSKGRQHRRELSTALGINNLYLGQLALGRRQPSESLALTIEFMTHGEVSIDDLRPDLAHKLREYGYTRNQELRQAA